ncbi:MAG: hypothetical protein ACJAZN_004041, partial [Planctomycetota bacterium]
MTQIVPWQQFPQYRSGTKAAGMNWKHRQCIRFA